ncbi:CatB-related O-acetyltransferase [Bacteroides nordii]|uniref:CatB-related O-acetyltransferase n=1 Tax=Bacteroides nordii TaxID=291645 RepID=UPI0024317016|nr:CatB-related O-acetyltransferase [Bacteroides nordii]
MNNLLIKLYSINNGYLRRIIEKILLRIEGGYSYSTSLRYLYKKYYGLEIGYGTYGGCFHHINFPQPCHISFGRYCSIGSGLKVFRANHPSNRFTTHPFLYNPIFKYTSKDMLDRPPLKIGNDVWTGSGVIICPAVKSIGDGAIIGAGSVVTHDVLPYTVVAGNPAKIIRKRFNEQQIAFLQDQKWWEYDMESLKAKVDFLDAQLTKMAD